MKNLHKRKADFEKDIHEGKGPAGAPYQGHRDKWERDLNYRQEMYNRNVCRDWVISVPECGVPDKNYPRVNHGFDEIDFA
jgi:hypothetical protein